MPRPRNRTDRTTDEIRAELFADFSNPVPDNQCPDHLKKIFVFDPSCPYAHRKTGMVLEARLVWWLNHPTDRILKSECIRHINKGQTDNNITNLKKEKIRVSAS